MSYAKDKLQRIGELEKNWNGFGAEPYSEMLIKYVSDLIDTLPVEPDIYPLANIGIQLDIPIDATRMIEIEVCNDFRIMCSLFDDTKVIQIKDSVGMKDVNNIVGIWMSVKEPSEYPRL